MKKCVEITRANPKSRISRYNEYDNGWGILKSDCRTRWTPRKLCVVTGSRADYGLLFWLMKEIREDPELELQIIATGMHLSPEFGLTYKEIEKDFSITEKVEMLLSSDTPVGIAKSVGLGIIGFADTIDRIKPDIVVILGDRFELLSAASAAMIARIPIAHIHGGEVAGGTFDNQIRHAITKLAYFHFAATEQYQNRIIQMGESPDRVWNVGTPGLDNFTRLHLLDKFNLQREMDFDLGTLSFLVTYHPLTLSHVDPGEPFAELLGALDAFPDARIIFTKANADTEGRIINKMIDEYSGTRSKVFTSMGQRLYLSTMQCVDAVIGNSSSGIIEAPYIQTPTVNIGDRQKDRMKAKSIINCPERKEEIVAAIKKAISSQFRDSLYGMEIPYGHGDASRKIKEHLKNAQLGTTIKQFYEEE